MSKLTKTAMFAAIIAAAAPGAYAQTSATPATHPAVTSHMIQSDEVRASKMIGSAVYDLQNRDIGKVRDLVLDRDGRISAVIVDVGSFLGMGGKNVAVKLSDLKTDNNRLTLDRTKEQLQSMAEYRLENRNTGAGTSASTVHGGHLGTSATTR